MSPFGSNEDEGKRSMSNYQLNFPKQDESKCLPLRTELVPRTNNDPTSNSTEQQKYHDYYRAPPLDDPEARLMGRSSVVENFPEKLHKILSQAEIHGFTDVVTWQPHGRSFVILQAKKFAEEILPKYFKQSKFTSFQRQVNLYGFCRLTKGRDSGGYYHELFLRGRSDLSKLMVRRRIKGTIAKSPSPDDQPDLYAMEPCLETKMFMTHNTRSLHETVHLHGSNNTSFSVVKIPVYFEGNSNPANEERDGCTSLLVPFNNKSSNGNSTRFLQKLRAQPKEIPQQSSLVVGQSLSSMASTIVSPLTYQNIAADLHGGQRHLVSPVGTENRHAFAEILPSSSMITQNSLLQPSSGRSSFVKASATSEMPRSGEAVFFEGRPFRYLDSMIVSDTNSFDLLH